ncbi:uncharacterized protein LOC130749647 [Lotus japonicus]|uniref:uncharacterized protein LOC130749647 n=1 Tax=Lotus japonicus TaxID=34305 RepID=UPI00258EC47B|nr:uncharacterized protein LOC130749647 [Lotus japonicus]
MKGIYFPNGDFRNAAKGRNASRVWMSLLQGRNHISENSQWMVSNDQNINIIKDRWLSSGEKLTDIQVLGDTKVASFMDQTTKSWKMEQVNTTLPQNKALKVLQTPISWSSEKDYLIWPLTKDGEYSVKSGYKQAHAMARASQHPPSSSAHIQSKTWHLLCQDPLCPVCQVEEETTIHTFLECSWARAVWFGSPLHLAPAIQANISFSEWLQDLFLRLDQDPDPSHATMQISLVEQILWHIWKTRNNACFHNKKPDPAWTIGEALRALGEDVKECLPPALSTSQEQPREPARGRNQIPKRWCRPPPNFVKCNVDAAFPKSIAQGATGIIVRDGGGLLITGRASRIHTTSPLVVEALAFREAISFMANTGYPKVVIESDCSELVKACKGEIKVGTIKGIVEDIIEIRQRFQYCAFTWTPREGNLVAHLAAKSCLEGNLGRNWSWCPPMVIFNALQKDMAHI